MIILATQFQNRLIGTVILVALGVAFIPDLLMGKKNDVSAPAGSIPLHPEATAQQSGSIPIQTAPQNQPGQQVSAGQAVVASGAQPAAQQGQTVVAATGTTGAVTINNPAGISAPGTAVVASGSTSGNTTTVVGGSPTTAANPNAHPTQNANSWGVQEVAPAVTVGDQAVSGKPAATVNMQQQRQKLAEQQAKQQAALLAAQQKKAQLLQQQQLALQKKKEQEAQQAMAILNATPAEKPASATAPEPRKEDGLTVMTPDQVASLRAHKTAPTTATTTTSHSSATDTRTATPAPATTGSSWVVQVGVFSNGVNANSLASKLRSAGVSATTQRWGQLTRVIVGPSTSRDQLQSMLPRINSASGIAGRVVPYTGH